MNDPYDLRRFVRAQEPVYDDAVAILRRGMMCTAYMDFIFPRLADVDASVPASAYGLRELDEARAFLAFPLLGNRYRECLSALAWLNDRTALEVFGTSDSRKLHASLTLFAEAGNEPALRTMLDIWFDNLAEAETMALLEGA